MGYEEMMTLNNFNNKYYLSHSYSFCIDTHYISNYNKLTSIFHFQNKTNNSNIKITIFYSTPFLGLERYFKHLETVKTKIKIEYINDNLSIVKQIDIFNYAIHRTDDGEIQLDYYDTYVGDLPNPRPSSLYESFDKAETDINIKDFFINNFCKYKLLELININHGI